MPPSYVTIEQLRGITIISTGEGISRMFSCIALDAETQYNLALFGPEGRINAIIYDVGNHEWKGQLSDEQGDILDVDWYNRGPVTAGSDGSVSVWSPGGTINYKFQAHETAVVGIDLMLVKDLLATVSRGGEWSIHDLVKEETIATFRDDAGISVLYPVV